MKVFHLGNSKLKVLEMLPENRIKKVQLGDQEIAVVRVGERVSGFHVFCPHRGASLIQASLNIKGEIVCPLHQYRFDSQTGQAKSGDCADLQTYACELSESGLKIIIP